jgi:hypothetical protein
MVAAGTAGLIAPSAAGPARSGARTRPQHADGTPEQVHLTWGSDPARTVLVSWASPGRAERPRVRIGQRVIAATERGLADPSSGLVSWSYHARVDGLRPGATYGYAVTADNDSNGADPFSATFSTAPEGRAFFRFTSFGDLAAADPARAGWSGRAAYAVAAVETFQPLFHLLNGELPEAAAAPGGPAQARREAGNQLQPSAAYRPWLPVPGSHDHAAGDGEERLAAFLSRYTLPSNGADGFEGRWYAFRVGTVLFVCLSGDDVADAGPGPAGAAAARDRPGPLVPAQPQSTPPLGMPALGTQALALPAPGAGAPAADAPAADRPDPGNARGFSAGAQTRWLEGTLATARADASIDWIVVQLHPCACSSGPASRGSDLGVRREWLPLFDTYEVDLVLSGHDAGYERSFPVRGFDPAAGIDPGTGASADTRRPHPVITVDSGVFDTSQGTVHLALGGGGAEVLGCGGAPGPGDDQGPGGGPGAAASAPAASFPDYPLASPGGLTANRLARVLTRPAPAAPGAAGPAARTAAVTAAGESAAGGAEAVEAATWSARRDDSPGYGIAVFDVSPGTEAGGQTSITVRYYHAATADPMSPAACEPGEPTDDYTVFEAFTLVRPRSDGRRWHLRS